MTPATMILTDESAGSALNPEVFSDFLDLLGPDAVQFITPIARVHSDRGRQARPRCAIASCQHIARQAGWCLGHYRRWVETGSPTPSYSADDRFWPKVTVLSALDSCWPWSGATYPNGYGHFTVGSVHTYAHRYALEQAMGEPLPDGIWSLHTCDNPICVRNDEPGTYEVNGRIYPRWGHLWPGDAAANAQDREQKGRGRSRVIARSRVIERRERQRRNERCPRAKLDSAQVKEILELRKRGFLNHVIAARFGIHPSTVSNLLHGYSWGKVTGIDPRTPTSWPNETAPHASTRGRLSAAAVREIRQRYVPGKVTQRELADEYGVSPRMVRRVLNRQACYQEVPDSEDVR